MLRTIDVTSGIRVDAADDEHNPVVSSQLSSMTMTTMTKPWHHDLRQGLVVDWRLQLLGLSTIESSSSSRMLFPSFSSSRCRLLRVVCFVGDFVLEDPRRSSSSSLTRNVCVVASFFSSYAVVSFFISPVRTCLLALNVGSGTKTIDVVCLSNLQLQKVTSIGRLMFHVCHTYQKWKYVHVFFNPYLMKRGLCYTTHRSSYRK
jgi:hypothetical protein